MLPPSFSSPARSTASAAPSPPSQPSARAASAASRAISADLALRERGEEPPFSPSGTGGASASAAAGRASQILSFTSTICPTAAVNSAYRAISRRTFSTSAAASCRPTVLRLPADRVHKNRGPCPG